MLSSDWGAGREGGGGRAPGAPGRRHAGVPRPPRPTRRTGRTHRTPALGPSPRRIPRPQPRTIPAGVQTWRVAILTRVRPGGAGPGRAGGLRAPRARRYQAATCVEEVSAALPATGRQAAPCMAARPGVHTDRPRGRGRGHIRTVPSRGRTPPPGHPRRPSARPRCTAHRAINRLAGPGRGWAGTKANMSPGQARTARTVQCCLGLYGPTCLRHEILQANPAFLPESIGFKN